MSAANYDPVAKIFHWGVLVLLAAQYAVGWIMPPIHRGTQPERWINLHLSLGTLIILVMLLRLVWRITHPVPLLRDGVPRWLVGLGHATHHTLYALLLVMPVLGWANANSRGWDVTLLWVLPLPNLVPAKASYGHVIGDVHMDLAYVLLALVALHAAGGLYHHVRLRDGVLQRMLP